MKILLIEDDLSTLNFIRKGLKESGHVVDGFSNGKDGLDAAYLNEHDVIILDRMLPEIDGLTIVTKIRNNKITTPVLFLSALGEVDDRVKGLKAGGDDYLTKPFDSEILLFKIKSIFKRKKLLSNKEPEKNHFDFANFKFDSKLRTLQFQNENPIKLSPKESELLKMLLSYTNDLMPRELALVKIWNDDNYFTSRSMDVYIAKIRKYLSKDSKIEIENIHGEGFRLLIND